MAITIDGKVYRNLEEQVEKNKKDIAEFKEQAQSLSQFGIKVVSQVAVEGLIPSVIAYKAAHSDWEYGDTYAVGSEAPYKLYILTRADEDDHPEDYWFNIGQFPVAGPQGAQGIQGETGPQGTRGSKWSVGTSFPSSANVGDLFLYSTTSQVFQYNGSTWDNVASIKGAQGIQGIQGPKGDTGSQGPQGPQGLQGPVGGTFTIKSTLSSTSLLPDPDESPRNEAYLIPVNDINHIYIIEDVDDALSWVDAGQFTGAQGEQGPQGPQGEQGLPGDAGPQGPKGSEVYGYNGTVISEPEDGNVYNCNNYLIIKDASAALRNHDIIVDEIGNVYELVNGPIVYQALFIGVNVKGPQGEMGALNSSNEITYDTTSQSCLLASTVRNKINSALQTPAVAPSTHYIVGIDSTNAQENISIGSGLEIDNGALKATGGGYTAGQNITISSAGVISIPGTQSGTDALAIGTSSVANKNYAFAIGNSASASALNTVAVGYNAQATGNSCNAIGYKAKAQSQNSIAIGRDCNASSSESIAIGSYANAGGNAIAIGNSSEASGNVGISIGHNSQATNTYSTAIGYSAISNAQYAVQIGPGTNAVANTFKYRSTEIVDTNGKITTNNLAGVSTATAGQVLTANGDGTATFQTAGGGGGLNTYHVELLNNNNFLNIIRKVNFSAKGRIWIEIPDLIDTSESSGKWFMSSVVKSDDIIGMNFSLKEDYYRYNNNVLEIDNNEIIYSLRKTTSGTGAFNNFLLVTHDHTYNTGTEQSTESYSCTDYSEYISELTSYALYYENDSEISFT